MGAWRLNYIKLDFCEIYQTPSRRGKRFGYTAMGNWLFERCSSQIFLQGNARVAFLIEGRAGTSSHTGWDCTQLLLFRFFSSSNAPQAHQELLLLTLEVMRRKNIPFILLLFSPPCPDTTPQNLRWLMSHPPWSCALGLSQTCPFTTRTFQLCPFHLGNPRGVSPVWDRSEILFFKSP